MGGLTIVVVALTSVGGVRRDEAGVRPPSAQRSPRSVHRVITAAVLPARPTSRPIPSIGMPLDVRPNAMEARLTAASPHEPSDDPLSDPRSELLELKAQLRRAVEGENFELAAELRDRIRVLE